MCAATPAAVGIVVHQVDQASKDLIKVTHDALMKAIAIVKPGVRYRDVGDVISKHVHQHG
jgi:methionyl aminopeptidase